MAKNDNLKDFLLDLADVIRAKTKTVDLINPQDFGTKISQIKSIEESDKQYILFPKDDANAELLLLSSSYTKGILDGGVVIGPPALVNDIVESFNYVMIEIDLSRLVVEGGSLPIETVLHNHGINISNYQRVSKLIFDSVGTSVVFPFVDLGLPSHTLWGSCNVGASTPEECGLYFHWGDLIGTDYTKFYYATGERLADSYNSTDNKSVLEPSDDAVYVQDPLCQIPSPDDFQELFTYTNISYININGVYGYEFISKNNGQSIFIPANGYSWNNNRVESNYGYLWTNTRDVVSNASQAHIAYLTPETHITLPNSRCAGCCIRPIQKIKIN